MIFLAAIDPPGADGVKRLYAYMLDKAMEAIDVWPKVECSDRVRYAVYPDGTVYLLNTEANLRQEAIVRSSVDAEPMRVLLNPCELVRMPFDGMCLGIPGPCNHAGTGTGSGL